jgi:predicted component of type VI protein secretion system
VTALVFVEEKPMEGREVEAVVGAVIGREGTDIVVADPEISRRHAAIREHGEGIAIEDLGSTNGTFVNDQRIDALQPLKDGDNVRIGNTVWRLRAPAAAESGATRIGQVAAPQVTAARAVPTDIEPPTAQQPAAPAAPQPAAPAQPPAQAPAAAGAPSPASVGPRGDVPAPPDVAPSAVRRVLPPPGAGQQAPAFGYETAHKLTSRRGSAAKRVEATVVCLLIVIAAAVALTVYFASQS